MFEMKQVLFLVWVTEECGAKALKEDMKVVSLTQDVRNTLIEMKYDGSEQKTVISDEELQSIVAKFFSLSSYHKDFSQMLAICT